MILKTLTFQCWSLLIILSYYVFIIPTVSCLTPSKHHPFFIVHPISTGHFNQYKLIKPNNFNAHSFLMNHMTQNHEFVLFAHQGKAALVPQRRLTSKISKSHTTQISDSAKIEGISEKKEKESELERRKRLKAWRVILHNDDIHSFQCVEEALIKVLPQLSSARAYSVVLHAHTYGLATIYNTWEEKANEIAESLQGHGLTVSTLPNTAFKQDDQS